MLDYFFGGDEDDDDDDEEGKEYTKRLNECIFT